MFKELYNYRELLKSCVKKEIRGKYKGSLLGVLWSFINPLLTVLVYAIVFPYIMRSEMDNYLIFLVVAIIPWNFFTVVLNQGMGSIRANEGIVKKVYFPREILPLSVVISGLINFFISCIIILAFCIGAGVGISWHLILLPIIALLQFFITLGAVLAFSAINVYIKDVEYIIGFIINMLFYGTPILYEISLFKKAPEILLNLVKINPFTHLMDCYRNIFLYHEIPNLFSVIYLLVISIITMLLGLLIFKKLQKGFAEEL